MNFDSIAAIINHITAQMSGHSPHIDRIYKNTITFRHDLSSFGIGVIREACDKVGIDFVIPDNKTIHFNNEEEVTAFMLFFKEEKLGSPTESLWAAYKEKE